MHIVLKKKAFGQVRSTLFFSFEYSVFNLYILQAYSNYREQGRKAFSFSRYRAKEINEKENQQKKEQKRKSH